MVGQKLDGVEGDLQNMGHRNCRAIEEEEGDVSSFSNLYIASKDKIHNRVHSLCLGKLQIIDNRID